MSVEYKKRGRKMKTIDLSMLAEVNDIDKNMIEEEREPFFITCAICQGSKDIAKFKRSHICVKCIELIRSKRS